LQHWLKYLLSSFKGQYVRVSRHLPQANLYDLLAIGDQQGADIIHRLDGSIPHEGSWGDKAKTPGEMFNSFCV